MQTASVSWCTCGVERICKGDTAKEPILRRLAGGMTSATIAYAGFVGLTNAALFAVDSDMDQLLTIDTITAAATAAAPKAAGV